MPARSIERPIQVPDRSETASGEWLVIVWNNDTNTFDEVILILQRATGCALAEAEMETWEIHHLGRSIVHHGEQEECERVAAIIGTIGIRVTLDRF